MKQHITYIQLEELTNDQRKKLKVWWYGRPEYDPPFEFQQSMLKYEQRFKQPCLPAPSEITIGQMLDLLDKNKESICVQNEITTWDVYTNWDGLGETYDRLINKPELADALWEAVKEVLNK